MAQSLVCAAILCAVAALRAAAAEGPDALLLAQADNQPAAAPAQSPAAVEAQAEAAAQTRAEARGPGESDPAG